jgi:cold shock CspA family protein
MSRETGTVYSVSPRGWIFIHVTPQNRFFAHISEIKADRMPNVGERVSFTTAQPRKEGQLPCAQDVRLAELAEPEVK